MSTIAANGSGGLSSPRLEIPGERREQPGPAQQLTSTDHLDRRWSAARRCRFQGHLAGFDQIERIGWLALAKNDFPRLEQLLFGSMQKSLPVLRLHTGQKRVLKCGC